MPGTILYDHGSARIWGNLALPVVLVFLWAAGNVFSAAPNLALQATVTGTSEYSDKYRAQFVADGHIPKLASRDDVGRAWAVKGTTHRDGAALTFAWEGPVQVAELLYHGRTAWANECFRGFEIRLDGGGAPVVTGKLKSGHGPQRITLPEARTLRTLQIRFTSSYGGPNPGASEIGVFSVPVPASQLASFKPLVPGWRAVSQPKSPPPPDVPESPALLARFQAGELGFHELLVVQRHHIRCSHVYTYHCEGQRNGGGLYLMDVQTGAFRELVGSRDGQISSCDLSYDGRRVLFSWRQEREYQVFTINVDGTGLRQLTQGSGHNYDACWLPDGDVAFLSTRVPQAAYCFFTPVGILYRMRPDGSSQTKLSANYLNDFTPAVLNDGRLLYGRWEYVDRPAIPIQSLWTINPDGTGLAAFFGNRVLDPATFIEPQPIPGTTSILCTLTGHNGSCRGAIGIVDPRKGLNAQAAIRNLTPEIRLRGVKVSSNGPRGPYQTPFPVDDRSFLVSYDGTLLLRDYDGTEQATVLKPRDGLGFYNPRPVRPRTVPPVRASNLPAEPEPWATLVLQDVHQGLEPDVEPGEVRRLCVVEELPRRLIDSKGIRQPAFGFQRVAVSCGATYVPKRVLGFAEIGADGSACFRVPARRPIYLLALDGQGRAVQRMRSFTHLMPGEVQGCVGCHEPRQQAPHHPGVLPAARLAPQELETPDWGEGGFNYASVVQPVLDQHCVRCHGGATPAGNVDLAGDLTDFFSVSYETLARGRDVLSRRGANEVSVANPYTNWIPTYNGQEGNILKTAPKTWGAPRSALVDLVLTGHRDLEGRPRVHLTRGERQRIITWVDLNVPYYGTADTAYPDQPACRRQYPPNLDRVLAGVASRRCIRCHSHEGEPRVPRRAWTRISTPRLNSFLLAPLAKAAGGTQMCGKIVFKDTNDPDYQAILRTFDPVLTRLKQTPRMDMAGARPAACLRGNDSEL
ncbi:MAG: hypothetical protein HN742_26040 [Lentisphaerae bacterium]|jgi:hypothetical protein|nr:hypothetical protein [Lentisphaerota bacterium]MBT5605575.1 hypothetical protein [Lentisphaerota bacterium]MBT7056852.1 hypothetical protein [Lentisphaerota bacterium]MBT7845362.1 hypothetical protein [Lentisphaerota bacterium]